MSKFDTIIKNGLVVTASETIEADVGIKDGRIVDLGLNLGGAYRRAAVLWRARRR